MGESMKIAVITGSSSGLGVEFVKEVLKQRADLDEVWIIARRTQRLEQLRDTLSEKIVPIALDITAECDCEKYRLMLERKSASVQLLINNAGYGKLGLFEEIENSENSGMLRLNCEALTAFCSITLPFMKRGGEIINTCSIASFAPTSRMAVYCSTKAYVMSFSSALRQELKSKGINVLAVCPGPMDTEFLSRAGIEKGVSHTFDTLPRVNPARAAEKSLKASAKHRRVYTPHPFYKLYRFLAKILPHSIVMKMSAT